MALAVIAEETNSLVVTKDESIEGLLANLIENYFPKVIKQQGQQESEWVHVILRQFGENAVAERLYSGAPRK